MKKVSFIITVMFFIMSLTACENEANDVDKLNSSEGKISGVSLVLQSFSSNGVTFILNNETKHEYIYGEDYNLKIFKNGTWQDVPYVIEGGGFDSIGYELKPNSITEKIAIDWVWLYGNLPDGKYKFEKTVLSNDSNKTIAGEFELVNGEAVKAASYTLLKIDADNKVIAKKTFTDENSMKIISTAYHNAMIKSERYQIDTSNIITFYKVKIVYTNDEISEITFLEKDGKAYCGGAVCDYNLYQKMISLLE